MGRSARGRSPRGIFERETERLKQLDALVRGHEQFEARFDSAMDEIAEDIARLEKKRDILQARMDRLPEERRDAIEKRDALKRAVRAMSAERKPTGIDSHGRVEYSKTRIEKVLELRRKLAKLEED